MKHISIVLLLLISIQSKSQKHNSISFNLGMMKFAQSVYPLTFFTIRGINYERKIRNIKLGIAYNRWVKEDDKIIPLDYESDVKSKDYYLWNLKATEKKLVARQNYFMIDFNFFNKLLLPKKIGELYVGGAFSYTQGKNSYCDTVILSPYPPFDDIDISYYHKTGRYFGLVPTINYNYYLFKEKIILGIHVRARKYFGLNDTQFDLGIHFGYNF